MNFDLSYSKHVLINYLSVHFLLFARLFVYVGFNELKVKPMYLFYT